MQLKKKLETKNEQFVVTISHIKKYYNKKGVFGQSKGGMDWLSDLLLRTSRTNRKCVIISKVKQYEQIICNIEKNNIQAKMYSKIVGYQGQEAITKMTNSGY